MAALWNDPNFQFVFWALVKIVAVLVTVLTAVAYATFAERKIAGHIQARTGPNRVGPLGLFQPLADVGKLLLKEEFTPDGANKVVYHLAPMLAVIPAFVTFAVIPFGPTDVFVITDLNVGLLLFLAMSSLAVYAITLGGWSSNNKYALLGALRSSAQMISYELSMGLSTIPILLMVGSLSLVKIVEHQDRWWFAVSTPFGFLAFAIFLVTAFAETNRAPFDLAEDESAIVAGFHTEYSGMGFALFFLAEYANMILVAGLTSVMFLGGWLSPFPFLPDGFIWIAAKMSFVLFLFLWFRATFPRYRYDQIMRLGWKVFIPVTLVWIILVAAAMQTPFGYLFH